ncbi:30S ribosomal protein S3, partial [Aeromonas hydrophila]
GVIGVKVWIFKGEVLGGLAAVNAAAAQEQAPAKPKRDNKRRAAK